MVDNGHRVVFDAEWSYVKDRKNGERTTLVRENRLYALRAWVRSRNKVTPPTNPVVKCPKPCIYKARTIDLNPASPLN